MAQVDDFKNLMNGLTNNNISLPVLYMSNVENGKDLTGFNTEWEGWFVWTKKDAGFKMPLFGSALLQTVSRIANAVIDAKCNYYWKHDNGSNNNQMEFMTCGKDGKYGHVRMKKSGSMEIVENEYYNGDWWLMQVRMVQPLNVKTK